DVYKRQHTTHHRPEMGVTFQIGSGQHLANASGLKVICDFRTNDVALKGQGAPLVPIGDQLFFGGYDFCLNLGGIANISFDTKGERKAYDIGLANMILNHITRKNGLDYDKGGTLARSGVVNTNLLQNLNHLEFYRLPYPKSIGYEWFVKKVIPLVDAVDDKMENLLCTGVHHICEQVAVQVRAQSSKTENSLLVTGGGALNDYLIETLQQKLGGHTKVVVPKTQLIEFKEALVFALMGVLRIEGKINVLKSVTGAVRDSSSGVVFLPA
ncbi:MAG TPA: anhydro-N-acetylmuramic acid kinase, partial [Pricia sp.]|nr:anhydro-N-acetylmuramic acid kinase [Pricia sp.]